MDDFVVSSLHESKNEWVARLIYVLTPHIIEGMRSIFDESVKLCKDNNEMEKYLMTFQNFVSRIPKWNENIIDTETKRIIERSSCRYLEDLITCVHIIQLKLLSAIRVGQKQKKININIPKLNDFVHKIYIHLARKVYKNVYLYELNVSPLKVQRNLYNLERIVEDCIMHAVRESIPLETLLQAYMDESVEEEVVEEVKEEIVNVEPLVTPENKRDLAAEEFKVVASAPTSTLTSSSSAIPSEMFGGGGGGASEELLDIPDLNKIDLSSDIMTDSSSTNLFTTPSSTQGSTRLSFSDNDFARDTNNQESIINAPKNVERLEEISRIRLEQSKRDAEDDDDGGFKLKIGGAVENLDGIQIHTLDSMHSGPSVDIFSDIEELK